MMNNTEVIGLAKRAVSLPGWRWMPGMRIVDPHGIGGFIVLAEGGEWKVCNRAGSSWLSAQEIGACLPDLSDPAVGGVLLDMLGEQGGMGTGVWFVGATAGAFGWTARRPGESPAEAVGRTGLLSLAEACVFVAVDLGGWPEAS